jgi:hypothetical protein
MTFRTPMGEVTVQLDAGVADDVEVVLSQGGKRVTVSKANDWSVTLNEGIWELAVKSDDHRFIVGDKTVDIVHGKTAEVSVIFNPAEIKRGLVAELFGDSGFKQLVTKRVDPQINFGWGVKAPDDRLPVDSFSVRWTGWLKPPVAGRYRFNLSADDRASLWLDDTLLLDRDYADVEAVIELDTRPRALKVEFQEGNGAAYAYLTWTLLGASTEHVIPAESLFQDRASAEAARVSSDVLVKRADMGIAKIQTGAPIDVLKLVDTERDTVRGHWWFDGDSLMCDHATPAVLQLPCIPPAEYDVTMVAQRLDRADHLFLGTPAGGRQFGITVDGGGGGNMAAVEAVDGQNYDGNNETRATVSLVPTEHPVTLRYAIRKSGVTLSCDGETIIDWPADYRRCSLNEIWTTPSRRHLSLATWRTSVRISKLQVVPLTAEPQPFPDEVPPSAHEVLANPKDLPIGEWTDILPCVDVTADRATGNWWRNDGGIVVEPGSNSKLALPVVLDGSYEMEIAFTRVAGQGQLAFMLPVGASYVDYVVEHGSPPVSGFYGLNLRPQVEASSAVPGELITDQKLHRLHAVVQVRDEDVDVEISLNDKPLSRWQGTKTALSAHQLHFGKPILKRPGIGVTGANVSYAAVRIKMTSGQGYLLPADRRDREPYRLTHLCGKWGGATLCDFAPGDSCLIGIRVGKNSINSIQPLYRLDGQIREGLRAWYPAPEPIDIVAREGYAVGGLKIKWNDLVHGLKVVFMRLRGESLDPADSYESDWVGSSQGLDFALGCTGERVIGIYTQAGAGLDGIGLVLSRRQSTTALTDPELGISLTDLIPFRSFATIAPYWKRSADDAWTMPHHPPVPREIEYCKEFLFAHAPSRVVYAVPDNMRSFTAVGQCLSSQQVSFQVLADGVLLFKSPAAGIVPIRVNLPRGCRAIELIADPLGDSFGDVAYWLYPRFHPAPITQQLELDGHGEHGKCVELTPLSRAVGYSFFGVNKAPNNPGPVRLLEETLCDEFVFAHAPSQLTYAIPEGTKEFSAVGYAALRPVRFRIYVDNHQVFSSRSGCTATPIRVPIPRGAKKLDLVVDQGADSHDDWAFWCYPRFHRTPSGVIGGGTAAAVPEATRAARDAGSE